MHSFASVLNFSRPNVTRRICGVQPFLISLLCLVFVCSGCFGSGDSELEAREDLRKIGVAYSPDSFVEKIIAEDALAVDLFLQAGMDPNYEVDVIPYFKSKGYVADNAPPLKLPVLFVAQQKTSPAGQEIAGMLVRAGASEANAANAIKRAEQYFNRVAWTTAPKSDGDKKTGEALIDSLRKKFERSESEYRDKIDTLSNTMEKL